MVARCLAVWSLSVMFAFFLVCPQNGSSSSKTAPKVAHHPLPHLLPPSSPGEREREKGSYGRGLDAEGPVACLLIFSRDFIGCLGLAEPAPPPPSLREDVTNVTTEASEGVSYSLKCLVRGYSADRIKCFLFCMHAICRGLCYTLMQIVAHFKQSTNHGERTV